MPRFVIILSMNGKIKFQHFPHFQDPRGRARAILFSTVGALQSRSQGPWASPRR